jgi:hypothetical protein
MDFVVPQANCSQIKMVESWEELIGTPFGGGVNALCWSRRLHGDFEEVMRHLDVGPGINPLDEDELAGMQLSQQGTLAVGIMLEDLRRLRERGLDPMLECVNGYLRDVEPGPVPTDVYSFHADSATVETDTYLCTYYGRASEGLVNSQSVRKVDVPRIRGQLLELYGGADDEFFREFLNENCFDLHYAMIEGAVPFDFGIGNLWRIAVEYDGCPVPPCIHRAPETLPGDQGRLLLIS